VDNISSATKQAIFTAGYVALFSSHGGIIGPHTDPYDIPRMGSSHESSPVYCLLEIEGLALGQVTSIFRPNGDRSAEIEC